MVAAAVRPAARRVLVPPWEAGVKDGEDEPSSRAQNASHGGDRNIEFIDVSQTMIAGDPVEGLAASALPEVTSTFRYVMPSGSSISAARAISSKTSEMSTPTTRAPRRASSRAMRP